MDETGQIKNMDEIFRTSDYAAGQAPIAGEKPGENHVYFLPYLMGERSPMNDTNARGTLIGMAMDTSRADLTQAVLEGVAFAIRDSVEVARSLGVKINASKIRGGGALVRVVETVHPDPALAERYEVQYRKFRKIYPACKALFAELAQ